MEAMGQSEKHGGGLVKSDHTRARLSTSATIWDLGPTYENIECAHYSPLGIIHTTPSPSQPAPERALSGRFGTMAIVSAPEIGFLLIQAQREGEEARVKKRSRGN